MQGKLPLVERDVVRVVLLDSSDRLLLLHVRDLSNPAFGTAWELPGGGIEPGESHVQAAIREVREETGLSIAADQIRDPNWRRDVIYSYRGQRRLQHEMIAAAYLGESGTEIHGSLRVDFERDDLIASRWWSEDEVAVSKERFYPRSLGVLLSRFLAGEKLLEPLETWT